MYYKLIESESANLEIILTITWIPEGSFVLENSLADCNVNRLFLNVPGNDFFVRGVPGLGEDVPSTIKAIQKICSERAIQNIRLTGASMGASGAILYGALLDANCVMAIGPEIDLGIKNYRSYYWNRDKIFPAEYTSLRQYVDQLGSRLNLLFPYYDLSDYFAARILQQMVRYITWIPEFHSGGQVVNWHELFRSNKGFDELVPVTVGQSSGHTEMGTDVYNAICSGRYDVAHRILARLYEERPDNLGYICGLLITSRYLELPKEIEIYLEAREQHPDRNKLNIERLARTVGPTVEDNIRSFFSEYPCFS